MRVRSLVETRIRQLGQEFDVYGVAVWGNGEIKYCITLHWTNPEGRRLSKNNHWAEAEDFSIIDPTIPSDWECHVFDHQFIRLLIGPAFISESPDDYIRLVERDRHQMQIFQAYLQRQNGEDTCEP